MIINLHIGLPKTATTTLQNTVFPTYSGIGYHGKHGVPQEGQSLENLLTKCWTHFIEGFDYENSLSAWIGEVQDRGSKNILISNEGLMYWKAPRHPEASNWFTLINPKVDIPRSGPHPITEFLSIVLDRLPDDLQLRVILTLRNQGDLIGSLSAQTAQSGPDIVDRVLKTKDPSLEFHNIVHQLQETLGVENLLLVFYEDGLALNSSKIADYIGAVAPTDSIEETAKLNVKRVGEGVWRSAPKPPKFIAVAFNRLNATGFGKSFLTLVKKYVPQFESINLKMFTVTVEISAEQRQKIQSHFRKDNDKLSELVGRNLRELGY